MAHPAPVREWASFDDPDEDRTWLVDLSFLSSPWECIFGSGCQGVLTAPAPELEQGCCSYGAHFVDEEDAARIEAAAQRLSADQWQHRRVGRRRGTVRRSRGETVTRLVDGACVFLNRPGFPGGAGCALHRAALEEGREPLELKPEVCWQLPLRREDSTDAQGHVTSVLSQWQRQHWGPAGDEFAWWCSTAPEAYRAASPLYRRLRPELEAMVGPAVYRQIAAHLDQRGGVLLAHPVLRETGRAAGTRAPRGSGSAT